MRPADYLTTPVMRSRTASTATRHGDRAAKKGQHLVAPQFPAKDDRNA